MLFAEQLQLIHNVLVAFGVVEIFVHCLKLINTIVIDRD